MNALNKELAGKLKKESVHLITLFFTFIIIFKLLFAKESFGLIISYVFFFFWLFILPGFSLMYYWHEELDFIERLIIGTCLGLAITGIVGYNLGLIGIKMQLQGIILPLLCLALASFLILKKSSDTVKKDETGNDAKV